MNPCGLEKCFIEKQESVEFKKFVDNMIDAQIDTEIQDTLCLLHHGEGRYLDSRDLYTQEQLKKLLGNDLESQWFCRVYEKLREALLRRETT